MCLNPCKSADYELKGFNNNQAGADCISIAFLTEYVLSKDCHPLLSLGSLENIIAGDRLVIISRRLSMKFSPGEADT